MTSESDSIDTRVIHRVVWAEVFPWLMIFRALRLSTTAPILLVATVGTLLLPWGWRAAAGVLDDSQQAAVVWSIDPALGGAVVAYGEPDRIGKPSVLLPRTWFEFVEPLVRVFTSVIDPLRHAIRMDIGMSELIYYGLGFTWTVAVWGFFGGVIVRTAVMRFGREEREGLLDAARFVGRRYLSYVGTPFFAVAGIAVIAILSLPVGLLLRWDPGILVAALLWVFVLLGGLLSAVVLVGLLLGWPLMWGATSSEEMGDVFEATQRAFSYTFGRPIHYAGYTVLALAVGSAAFLVVQPFAQLVVYLSGWAVSWGSGGGAGALPGTSDSWTSLAGGVIISGLNALVLTVASAFRYSFFWCAVGAIYLLLRRDSDQIEFDNVYVPEEQPPYTLPPLTTDDAGVPGLDEAE
jgi:hypothetical protein